MSETHVEVGTVALQSPIASDIEVVAHKGVGGSVALNTFGDDEDGWFAALSVEGALQLADALQRAAAIAKP